MVLYFLLTTYNSNAFSLLLTPYYLTTYYLTTYYPTTLLLTTYYLTTYYLTTYYLTTYYLTTYSLLLPQALRHLAQFGVPFTPEPLG